MNPAFLTVLLFSEITVQTFGQNRQAPPNLTSSTSSPTTSATATSPATTPAGAYPRPTSTTGPGRVRNSPAFTRAAPWCALALRVDDGQPHDAYVRQRRGGPPRQRHDPKPTVKIQRLCHGNVWQVGPRHGRFARSTPVERRGRISGLPRPPPRPPSLYATQPHAAFAAMLNLLDGEVGKLSLC